MLSMTEEEINALSAGRELDGLVHEHIFGLSEHTWIEYYSTDVTDAFTVLEMFPAKDWYVSISNCCDDKDDGKWCVQFFENADRDNWICTHSKGNITEAICKAALMTRGKDARKNNTKKFPEAQETDD